MTDPAIHYQELAANYTVHRRKRKGPVVYLEANYSIDDAEPSDIMTLFLLPLL
jgi:hypothetical protein